MATTFDPAKREATLQARQLDFLDAALVFAGPTFTRRDDRTDYGEDRFVTAGLLAGRMVMIVWTPRGADRHVFSMRKANDREQARFGAVLA